MNRVILLATLMGLSLAALVEGERNIFKEGLSEVNSAINDASKELKGILGSGEKAKEKEKAPVAPAPSAAAETRPKRGLLLARLFPRAAVDQVTGPAGAAATAAVAAAAGHEHHDMMSCKMNHPEKETRPKREAPIGGEQTASQNPFGSLANFGSQIEGAKMFGSIFGSTPSSANPSTSEIVGSLTSMVRSSQESGNKLASETQQNALQAQQVGTNAAQETQKGFVSALAEIGRGLKQISQNNPSLVPDVKNLFSSVSSKLNTSPFAGLAEQAKQQSSSIMPATNPQQLSDNLAKVSLPGLQTPA